MTLILLKTLALYKPCTYLLTYLLKDGRTDGRTNIWDPLY